MAAPFDAGRAEVLGQPVPVLSDVMQSMNTRSSSDHVAAAQFSFSGSGSLVYAPGGIEPDVQDSLVWVDKTGKPTEVTKTKGPYVCPRLSPDGKRIVYFKAQKAGVWVYDIAAGLITGFAKADATLTNTWKD